MNEEEKDFELSREDVDDSVVAEEHSGEQIKKLKDKLKEAEGKAREYLDGWQRERADMANVRKRDEEAKSEFIKFASANLLEQLIPVLDSFNLALAHGENGIKPVYDQLMQVLKQNGLEELNPIGKTFDPKEHEAVGVISTDNKDDDHKILEVMQKGYILFSKIIRPAKVRIGEYKE